MILHRQHTDSPLQALCFFASFTTFAPISLHASLPPRSLVKSIAPHSPSWSWSAPPSPHDCRRSRRIRRRCGRRAPPLPSARRRISPHPPPYPRHCRHHRRNQYHRRGYASCWSSTRAACAPLHCLDVPSGRLTLCGAACAPSTAASHAPYCAAASGCVLSLYTAPYASAAACACHCTAAEYITAAMSVIEEAPR
jgi:hypothetical protein